MLQAQTSLLSAQAQTSAFPNMAALPNPMLQASMMTASFAGGQSVMNPEQLNSILLASQLQSQ